MVGESNQNVFLIQIDASKFAEFELSKFDIHVSRFDCSSFSSLSNALDPHETTKRDTFLSYLTLIPPFTTVVPYPS